MQESDWLYFIVTLPYVLILSLAGGLGAFIMRLNQATEPKPLNLIFLKLLGELFLSGFAGLVTFLLCKELGLSSNMTAISVAISGHLGGNMIVLISEYLKKFFKNKFNV
ncbi:phage holin family protein [Moraxella boevrei]|uniref:phage holin family protein n=1 Tax=Faucicola boevrei TaxID=346665 RepID=UPI00373579D4